MQKKISDSRAATAFIASIFLNGLGHIIAGFVKRGIIILLASLAIGFIVNVTLFPFIGWFTLAFVAPIWVWQLYDLYVLVKKQKTQFQDGWETK